MKNKTELEERIKSLPKFRLRDIATFDEDETEWMRADVPKAVTEIDKFDIITTVSPRYTLVQFEDIFLPILGVVDSLLGDIVYHRGKAVMEIFPDGEDFKIGQDEHIGIRLLNSVNKTTSIYYEFVVTKNSITYYFPRKHFRFVRQIHVGNIENLTEQLPEMIKSVKKTWIDMVTTFKDYVLSEEEIESAVKEMKLGKRIGKYLELEHSVSPLNLWHMISIIMHKMSKRKYKTEMKKKERLEKISKGIVTWAFVLRL